MLHLVFKKLIQYAVVSSFGVLAFTMFYFAAQTQRAHQTSTAQVGNQLKNKIGEAFSSPSNIIYINNFPVKAGYITSHYGMRKDPFTGKRAMHRGIDIGARAGTSIYPVGEGKVIFSGSKASFGKIVEIEHSSTVVSRYSHLKKSLVKKGQRVTTRDIIAQVGSSGRSTGPHLHLEIVFNGEPENPRVYLSRELVGN
ncbi:MAG: M23 family metallopeptidase [Cocleimonas sp.]